MLCYRDMTFCSYYKECKVGENCFRALTDEILRAELFDLPICKFAEKPNCFKEKENE